MNDSSKLTPTPTTNASVPPPGGKKWKLRGPWAVVLAALITALGGLIVAYVALPEKDLKARWPAIEPVELDGKIRVELLGCHAEGNLGVICQLKLTSLATNHGILLRKDSISLVDRAGRNFPPATLAIDAQSPVEAVPFPTGLDIAQNVRVTFADVGNSLDDYELLRITFGEIRLDFRPPGKFPIPGKR